MTYRVVMETMGGRTITTNIAGCTDEDDAKAKALALYQVRKFKKVEPTKDKK